MDMGQGYGMCTGIGTRTIPLSHEIMNKNKKVVDNYSTE